MCFYDLLKNQKGEIGDKNKDVNISFIYCIFMFSGYFFCLGFFVVLYLFG